MDLDELVGAQVRSYRERRGMSQLELCAALRERTGVSMSKPTLIRLEQGRRPATVSEIAAFALTLNVTPAELVTPVHGSTEHLEVTPYDTTTPARAYFWWIGVNPPTNPRGFVSGIPHTMDAYEAALRRHVTQRFFSVEYRSLKMLEQMRDEPIRSQTPPSAEEFDVARGRVKDKGRQFVAALEHANAAGLTGYRVPAVWWPYLAASVGRADPNVWAADLGIEVYEVDEEDVDDE
jgi:transcriptional regulator with XRE-family HTH domain